MADDVDGRISRLEASNRRWRKATVASLAIAVIALVAPYVSLVRTGTAGPFAPSASLTPAYRRMKVDHLQVRSLDVVDEKGTSVVSMNEGAGAASSV